MYPPILNSYLIEPEKAVEIQGEGGSIHALPIQQVHGPINSLGFRFSHDGIFEIGGLCYSPDVSDIPETSVSALQNLEVWILDALQYKPHVSHFSVSKSLEWIERVKPQRAIFTHMHIPLDYNKLSAELPEFVEPAYDGMTLELDV
jgi:phosphoribosyl 1,2-cyclic phosphate phosphodiesterase